MESRTAVMIRLRAGLSPEEDRELRHSFDVKINAAIKDVGELRGKLNALAAAIGGGVSDA